MPLAQAAGSSFGTDQDLAILPCLFDRGINTCSSFSADGFNFQGQHAMDFGGRAKKYMTDPGPARVCSVSIGGDESDPWISFASV